MAKRKSSSVSRYTAARSLARARSIISEPYIKIVDRRNDYKVRRRTLMQQKIVANRRRVYHAPVLNRDIRQARNVFMQKVLPIEVYNSLHNCKRAWSKVLSWRSSQGSGSKRRTRTELRNSKRSFDRKDC